MIPLRDCIQPRRYPYINLILIVITLGIYLWEATLTPAELSQVAANYGVVPARLTSALEHPFSSGPIWLTLITGLFLHSGWLHILGNLLYLWVFGDNVEDRIGHWRYLLFYLGAGIIGGLAQVISDPLSNTPIIGASGAIAGVLGAYLISFPLARVETLFFIFIVRVPAVIFILLWFALQLFNGLGSLTGGVGQIAWWAHIGGFLGGIVLLLIMKTVPITNEETV